MPPPLYDGGAREALQPEGGLALSAPRGQTLSGTVHAPTPTCVTCPSARSLLQASLIVHRRISDLEKHFFVGRNVLLFLTEVREGVILELIDLSIALLL